MSNLGSKLPFKAIIFDLDDTLLETSKYIIPKAMRRACETMIEAGLTMEVETCVLERRKILEQNPRALVFDSIVEKYASPNRADEILLAGRRAFYQFEIDFEIRLARQELSFLSELQQKVELYLVTSGDPQSQKEKVHKLGIRPFFRQMYFVDSRGGFQKRDAFFEIVQTTGIDPSQILSVGNRIDNELAQSKLLGCQTCLNLRGEYSKMQPETSLEIPDYTIRSILELGEICGI